MPLPCTMASSSISNWTYDVFLSFRGSDVRKGFIGHLYAALCRDGIRTFLDEDKIEYGQEIGPACIKGIQESRISLIILSKDYASSTWCLEELNHILKFKDPDDIWPVFYDVDPSHVENITGSYEAVFKELEKRYKEDFLRICKEDLQKVSSFKRPDLQKNLDGHEAKDIVHIVKEILKRLNRTSLAITPVGLNSRANDVILLIDDEKENIRIIGIYGPPGIGKTTLAKEIYGKISNKFDSKCFLENVSKTFASKGIAKLQRQLLSATLERKYEKINNVDRGLTVIIERLRHKRVLLVLDDVNKLDQMNKILGRCNWLFPGSRVIITTKIKDFLQPTEMYRQYEVKALGYGNSLQLLNLHAYDKDQDCAVGDYMDYAEKFVDHLGGNPLALEVIGSALRGQNVESWRSSFKKQKALSDEGVYSKFELSYHSLDDTEKFIFLDIACFFIGYDKDYVTSILEGCRFFPVDGINTLFRRCLLQIDSDNKLVMHNLIRDMGRNIAQKDMEKNIVIRDPGKRSRLWNHEDVIDVLDDKLGTKAVEGLILNMTESKKPWKTKVFKKMKMLRLLQLNYVCLEGEFEHISSKLRWLCWHGFPLKSIPSDLTLENLVALDMRYSKLERFSEEVKSLKKLKFLNLSHSHELIETPDFESCPSLEKLIMKDCTKLETVHNSIGLLNNLVFWNLSGCSKLEELPQYVGLLTRLVFLNLQDCKNLKNLPKSISGLNSLKLNIEGCSNFLFSQIT